MNKFFWYTDKNRNHLIIGDFVRICKTGDIGKVIAMKQPRCMQILLVESAGTVICQNDDIEKLTKSEIMLYLMSN